MEKPTPLYTYSVSNRLNDDTLREELAFTTISNLEGQSYNLPLFDKRHGVLPDEWTARLIKDVERLVKAYGSAQVIFLIHGFGVTDDDSWVGQMHYGQGLRTQGLDESIVINVSWPSYTSASWTDGTSITKAMLNAEASGDLVYYLADLTMRLRNANSSVRVSVACHSMGNYLFTKNLDKFGGHPKRTMDTIVLLDAFLPDDIFSQSVWDWLPNYPPETLHERGEITDNQTVGDMYGVLAYKTLVFYQKDDSVLSRAPYGSGRITWWKSLGLVGPRGPNGSNHKVLPYSCEYPETTVRRFVPAEFLIMDLTDIVNVFDATWHSLPKFIPELLRKQVEQFRAD